MAKQMTEKQLLALAIGLVVLLVASFILVMMTDHHKDRPEPEPQYETVKTETQVEATAVQAPAPTSTIAPDPTAAPAGYTAYQTASAPYFKAACEPDGLEWNIENYLGWKTGYPAGWANLVRWGRGEQPPLTLDPAMAEASKLAACAQNIDDYMANYPRSPLGGHGLDFALAGYRHGINPYLIPALTAAESTFATDGTLSRTHHNAWGMKGPNKTGLQAVGGWMYWEDWPAAIEGAAFFVSCYWPGAQTAHDLRGYCVGNPPAWIHNVEIVREGMGGAPW